MKSIILLACLLATNFIFSQNTGVGTPTPAAPLHIKSLSAAEMLRIEGTNPYISFFDNTKGYIGYLWYDVNKIELGTPSGSTEPVVIAPARNLLAYFTPNGRVGIGISTPSEKLDVNGNINLNGLIKINSSSGTAGQVLTSNGVSDPQWKSTSYGNNIRFAFNFDESAAAEDDYVVISSRYNNSPANISISATDVALDLSGLYHFEIMVNARLFFASPQTTYPTFALFLYPGFGLNYNITGTKLMQSSSTSGTSWSTSEKLSFEVFLNGPITLRFWHHFIGAMVSSSHDVDGYVIAHMISE